jgi:ubiquinone/menaquinone biosynthesis C-methylase UbiE
MNADKDNGALACPRCRAALVEREAAAICVGCRAEYPVEDGVLCTDRANVFMGEFDARRMSEFTRSARERGWRRTAQEEMAGADPGVRTILLSPERASFVDVLGVRDTHSVLDLGAGMGAIALQLAKSFGQVYALDQAFERLAFLHVVAEQERVGSIRAVCHRDACRLPFRSDQLSAAVMIGVFEYFPLSYPGLEVRDVQLRALAELHRVLAPGGLLFIATKNRFGWPNWWGAKDNSGLRFGALLPRWLADAASRVFLRRPFRVVTDSCWAYAALLGEVGFGDVGFYWPVGGYQAARSWISLSDGAAVSAAIKAYPGGVVKRAFLSTLALIGAIKFAVPHFGIVARKPS